MSVLVFRQSPSEIACKDTTIFLSRCNFIEKLTPLAPKKSFSRHKKRQNDGKITDNT